MSTQKEREEVEQWKHRLHRAEKYREKFGDSNNWSRYRDYYRNDYDKTRMVMPVNMVFAISRSIIPRTYFRNPRVIVTPTSPRMQVQAKLVEAIDNWLVERIGIKGQIRRGCLDCFLYGTSVLKTGYDSEFGYSDPEEGREFSQHEEEMMWGIVGPEEDRIEYDDNILPGTPWAKRVHPRDYYAPWGYIDIAEFPWEGHRIIRHIDDVMDDDRYVAREKKNLKPTHRAKDIIDTFSGLSQRTSRGATDAEYVVLYEIFDKKSGRVKVVAPFCNGYLRNEVTPLLVNGLPSAAMVWNEDTEAFWGVPDAKIIEPQQLELNEIRTQYQEHRRMAILKFLVKKGAISPRDMEKLRSGEVGAMVEIDANLGPETLQEMKHMLQNDLLQAGNEVRRDIRETVGFSRNQLGEYDQSSRRTATEAEIVQQGAAIRVDERRDKAADMYTQALKRMNQYIFQFWDGRKVAQISGPGGMRQWVSFTGEQIRGEYDLRVDPDMAQAPNTMRRKQEALELLQVIAQFPPEAIDYQNLIRYVLEQYEGVHASHILNVSDFEEEEALPLEQLLYQTEMGGMGGPGGMPGDVPEQLIQQIIAGAGGGNGATV